MGIGPNPQSPIPKEFQIIFLNNINYLLINKFLKIYDKSKKIPI